MGTSLHPNSIAPARGARLISSQSRQPMVGVIVNTTRSAVIVAAATTLAGGSVDLQQFFAHALAKGINQLITGKDESSFKAIDENPAWTQVAMGPIGTVKTPANDIASTAAQVRNKLIVVHGKLGAAHLNVIDVPTLRAMNGAAQS